MFLCLFVLLVFGLLGRKEVFEVDLGGIEISNHALCRFSERWTEQCGQRIKNNDTVAVFMNMLLENINELGEEEANRIKSEENCRLFRYGMTIFVINTNLSEVITVLIKK